MIAARCRRLLAAALFAAAPLPLRAQGHAAGDTALASLVAAERAFARLAADEGTKPAFLANLADDAVLFRPAPVPGLEVTRQEPADSGHLAWYPARAGIAAAGDLGYTTGPFTYRAAGAADTAEVHGTYVTVWRRGTDGRWKVLVDAGAAGPAPSPLPAPWSPAADTAMPAAAQRLPAGGPDELRHADTRFGAASLAPDAVVLRPGLAPATGTAGRARVGTARATVVPTRAEVSASGDLGFTYGTEARAGRRSNYFRVWRRDAAGWRVVVDLRTPLVQRS